MTKGAIHANAAAIWRRRVTAHAQATRMPSDLLRYQLDCRHSDHFWTLPISQLPVSRSAEREMLRALEHSPASRDAPGSVDAIVRPEPPATTTPTPPPVRFIFPWHRPAGQFVTFAELVVEPVGAVVGTSKVHASAAAPDGLAKALEAMYEIAEDKVRARRSRLLADLLDRGRLWPRVLLLVLQPLRLMAPALSLQSKVPVRDLFSGNFTDATDTHANEPARMLRGPATLVYPSITT